MGMRLRRITGTVVVDPGDPRHPRVASTIAPAASPGWEGVATVSVTVPDAPGARCSHEGETVPKLVYDDTLAPKTTGPVVPPSAESRL